MAQMISHDVQVEAIRIPIEDIELIGDLSIPLDAQGIVLFVHGSGSSRHSSRNKFVAGELNQAHLATLLFDLLTEQEEWEERFSRHLRFDIPMLADRLLAAAEWTRNNSRTHDWPIGYFGASTGGGAALVAAAMAPQHARAVVSRGGRPDLAGDFLPKVQCPTLLIVGGNDDVVIELNQQALAQLRCQKQMRIVPGATHLFEEPGTLEQVANLARDWFVHHLVNTT
jgi:putative phosphoribosyl transferase